MNSLFSFDVDPIGCFLIEWLTTRKRPSTKSRLTSLFLVIAVNRAVYLPLGAHELPALSPLLHLLRWLIDWFNLPHVCFHRGWASRPTHLAFALIGRSVASCGTSLSYVVDATENPSRVDNFIGRFWRKWWGRWTRPSVSSLSSCLCLISDGLCLARHGLLLENQSTIYEKNTISRSMRREIYASQSVFSFATHKFSH